jgi:hypothetical protein
MYRSSRLRETFEALLFVAAVALICLVIPVA